MDCDFFFIPFLGAFGAFLICNEQIVYKQIQSPLPLHMSNTYLKVDELVNSSQSILFFSPCFWKYLLMDLLICDGCFLAQSKSGSKQKLKCKGFSSSCYSFFFFSFFFFHFSLSVSAGVVGGVLQDSNIKPEADMNREKIGGSLPKLSGWKVILALYVVACYNTLFH